MRNYLSAITLFFLFLTPFLAKGQSATVEIGNVFSPKDSTVCVPIIVDFSNVPGGVNGLDFYISFNPGVLNFLGYLNVHSDIEDLVKIMPREGYPDIIQVSWFDFSADNSIYTNDTLLCLNFSLLGEGCTALNFIFDTEIVDIGANEILNVSFLPGSVCEALPRNLILEVYPDSITTLAAPQGAGTYYRDEVVDISVEAVEGFNFIGWDAGNPNYQQYIAEPDSLSTSFTMPPEQEIGDIILTAVYEAILYSITILIDPTDIRGDPNPQGEGEEVFVFKQAVCISVDEVEGYVFVGWEADDPDDLALLDNPEGLENCFLMPSRDPVFTASYEPIPYTLTLLVYPDSITGQADPFADPPNPYDYPTIMTYHIGDEITLTAQDVEGYNFIGWVADDPDHQTLIGDADTLETTFTMPADHVTITATYELTKYTITLLVDPPVITDDAAPYILFDNPHGDPPDDIHYRMGDEIDISVQEVTGYTFVGWFPDHDDLLLASPSEELINGFTMPFRDVVLTARYELINYNLVIHVNPEFLTDQANITLQDVPWIPEYGYTFNMGDQISIDASQIEGFHFTGWTIDAGPADLLDDPGSWQINFDMPPEPIVLTANFQRLSLFLVLQTDPDEINDEANLKGAGVYYYEDEVTISASEVDGYRFSHWKGTYDSEIMYLLDDSTSMTNAFIMPGVFVYFTAVYKELYSLNLMIEGEGSAMIDGITYTGSAGPLFYTENEVVSLEAFPAQGWQFEQWNNTNNDSSLATSVNMDADKTVVVTFVRQQYVLHIEVVGGGTVSVDGTAYDDLPDPIRFHYGETTELKAVAAEGWYFEHWEDDIEGNTNPSELFMDGNKTVVARFERHAYELVIHTEGNGDVTVNGTPYTEPMTFLYGDNPRVRAIPAGNHRFDRWSGDMTGSINPQNLLMDGHKTVSATFSEIPSGQFVLTVDIEGNGQVSVNEEPYTSAITEDEGTEMTLTAIAAEGWHFVEWSGDRESTEPEETIVLNANKTITAIFAINQYSLIIDQAGQGSILVNGEVHNNEVHSFDHGTEVTLEAQAAEGWQFDGWSGDVPGEESADNPLHLLINNDKILTATFSLKQYTLTIHTVGEGQVKVGDIPYTYPLPFYHGDNPSLLANADDGWLFDGWSGDVPGEESADNPLHLLMDDNKTVTATFSEIPPTMYTLTINTEGIGSVTVNGNTYNIPLHVVEGKDVALDAIAVEGWQFEGWSGDLSGTDPSQNITMDGDKAVTAIFSRIEYTLTVVTSPGGQVLVNGTAYEEPLTFYHDDEPNLLGIPNEGWQFDGWSGDLSGTEPSQNLTIDGNKTVTATFTQIEYTLTIEIIGQGIVRIDGIDYTEYITSPYGSDALLLSAFPDHGWEFKAWSGDHTSSNHITGFYLTKDMHITATFEEIPPPPQYILTVLIEGQGEVTVDDSPYTTPQSIDSGSTVSLHAMAAEGWQFDGWSGDLAGQETPQNLTMNGDKTVTAIFSEIPPTLYTLIVGYSGLGSVTINGEPYDGPLSVEEGTGLTVVAIPAEGWQFDGWSGDLAGQDTPQGLTMNGDKIVTAIFSEIPPTMYTLTVNYTGNGSVTVNGEPYDGPVSAEEGTGLTLEAISSEGWQFDGWSGHLSGEENPESVVMDGDKTVIANFSEKQYTITFIVMNRSGILINDARITFNGTQHPEGVYMFGNLPAGSYSYTVSRDGFLNGTGTATITNIDIEVVVVLETDPVRTAFLKVYPNPTNYILTIESNESFRELEVYNALGQIVLSSSFNDRLKHTIEVGHLASGMYLVRVFSLNDRRSAKFEVIR